MLTLMFPVKLLAFLNLSISHRSTIHLQRRRPQRSQQRLALAPALGLRQTRDGRIGVAQVQRVEAQDLGMVHSSDVNVGL